VLEQIRVAVAVQDALGQEPLELLMVDREIAFGEVLRFGDP